MVMNESNDDNVGVNFQSTTTSNPQVAAKSKKIPGARSHNPLDIMSSYTYGLTLYMVSPEVINLFNSGGGTMVGINPTTDSVYVVAQSGGTDNTIEQKIIGAENLEYYIDDLVVSAVMPNSHGELATATTNIQFKLYESHGFTLLRNLALTSNEINRNSAMLKDKKPEHMPSLTEQPFILAVRFYGYDADGKQIDIKHPEFSDFTNGYANKYSVIERYFSVTLINVKFKLNGKAVTYNCEAKPLSEDAAFGEMNATLKQTETFSGSTVYDLLMGGINRSTEVSSTSGRATTASDSRVRGNKGLARSLNDQQESFKNQNQIAKPTKYKFQFLDADGNDVGENSPIARAKIYNDQTLTSSNAPMTKTSDSKKVNVSDSLNAVAVDKNSSMVTVNKGQTVLSVVDNLITKSTYVSDALNKLSTQDIETKNKDNAASRTLTWFSVNPYVTIIGRDEKLSNWAYEITYQIRPYEIPFVNNQNVSDSSISLFTGAYKQYEYWFTGKNSQIISYEMTYNNLFYQPIPMATGGQSANVVETRRTGVKKAITGSSGTADPNNGGINKGNQLNENLKVSLASAGDNATVVLKISGDPDYLMTNVGVNNVGISAYQDGDYQINPLQGQVFVKINFKSTDDYYDNGCLNIIGPIQFYFEEAAEAGIEGIIYMVKSVTNNFSKGSFTQTLDLVIVPENELNLAGPKKESVEVVQKRETDAETARLAKKYPPPKYNAAADSQAANVQPKRIGAAENVSPSDPRQAKIIKTDPTTGKLPTQQIDPKTLLPINNKGVNTNSVAPPNDDAVVGRPRGGY